MDGLSKIENSTKVDALGVFGGIPISGNPHMVPHFSRCHTW